MNMDPYILLLTGVGVIVLLTAWLLMVLKSLPLSLAWASGFLRFQAKGGSRIRWPIPITRKGSRSSW